MRKGWARREAITGGLASAWMRPARADPPAPGRAPDGGAPPPVDLDELVQLDLRADGERRMRAEVRVNGRGPFAFLIDTGADHSVLSREFAAALALPAAGHVVVHGVAGSALRPRALVRVLEVGGRKLTDQPLALLDREDLGALGVIGLDILRDQRIEIDLQRNIMQVRRPRRVFEAEPGIVVHGRSRFGQLVLVDSSIRRQRIFVVLDTGAELTVGNPALRAWLYTRRLARGEADPRRIVSLVSVTGQSLLGEADEVPELTLSKLVLKRVPVIYAELDTFRLFGLTREPALMLGMDVLRSFHRVFVDFWRREVAFELNRSQL